MQLYASTIDCKYAQFVQKEIKRKKEREREMCITITNFLSKHLLLFPLYQIYRHCVMCEMFARVKLLTLLRLLDFNAKADLP